MIDETGNDDGADSGGSGDGTTGTVGTGNDARLALYNQINDQLDSQRAEDLADVNDDGSTTPFRANGEEPPAEETTEITPEPATPVEETHLPKTVKLKINGEEEEVSFEEVIARAQKVSSADRYLADAKKSVRQDPEPPQGPSPEDVQRAAEEEERQWVRAIQMGTEEEALTALRKMRTTTKGPSISMDDIGRITDERLAFGKAIDWFNEEYKDLVEDPVLHQMVIRKDEEMVASKDQRPYRERYEDIGKEVRGWRDGMVKKFAPTPSNVADLTAKKEAKANAPSVPVPTNARSTQAVEDDDSEENPSEVIAAMREKRGGPQWARS